MNQKRWRTVGQGDFIKWTDPGQKVEGIWRGQHDGKFGPIGTVATQHGNVTFPLHTALLDKMADISEGTEVQIIYMGLFPTKNGKEFKKFNVGVVDEENGNAAPEKDDEVPF